MFKTTAKEVQSDDEQIIIEMRQQAEEISGKYKRKHMIQIMSGFVLGAIAGVTAMYLASKIDNSKVSESEETDYDVEHIDGEYGDITITHF